MSFISKPMGWILAQLSGLFGHNFAISVLVFTVLINLIMLPLTLKSQKSTAKQAKLKHKLDALKKKYGSDRQKYSMAMQELYNKEGISMGGGCLPMIIRLVLMMGVYYAIMSPFTYVAGINTNALSAANQMSSYVRVVEGYKGAISDADWKALGLSEKITDEKVVANAEKYGNNDATYYAKIAIVEEVNAMTDVKKDSAQERVKKKITECQVLREVEVATYLNENNAASYKPIVADAFVAKGGNIDDLNKIDFDMFGIDLRDTPNFSWNFIKGFNVNWLIPISSFLAAMLTGIITSRLQKKANPEAPNMMAMMLIMPIFSLVIAFGFPCAVGFYWACSSLVSGGLQILTQIFYGPSVVNAREQAKGIVVRAKQEKERMSRVDNQ